MPVVSGLALITGQRPARRERGTIDPEFDEDLIGPLERLGEVLDGGPHAALVDEGELRLASLPGRSRLWLVVLPGVLAARGLQEVVPESWPVFSVYVVLVLAAFYLGDRWSTRTTEAAFTQLTADEVAREPDVRLALDDIVRVAQRDRVFGGPELRIETADDTLRLAGDPAPVERLKARLPDSVLPDEAA